MFQLNDEECLNLRFQIETSNNGSGGRKYNPYVFTEQGVAMLSAVLNSKVADEVSVSIMDAFVAMCHYIMDNTDIYKSITIIKIEDIFMKNDLLNLIDSLF